MLNFISTRLRERETIRKLIRLSERELADIGIARQDVKSVVRRAAASRGQTFDAMAPSWGGHNRRALAN